MTTLNHASMVVMTTKFKASEGKQEGNFKKAFSEVINLANDIKIIAADGESLKTNRFILSVFSPILQTLLRENGGVSTTLHLPDCSFKSLQHLLSLFTDGISQTSFVDLDDVNDLIDTANLLSVDLKNLSFINPSSFGFEGPRDNSQNKTIITESFHGRNNEMKTIGLYSYTSDGKRRGRLSFEKNPSNFKKPNIDDKSRLTFTALTKKDTKNKVYSSLNQNVNECKQPPIEDSEFKSLLDNSEYKADQTYSLIPKNMIKNLPQSPKRSVLNIKPPTCSKKVGKEASFCEIHMKVHSGKKVQQQFKSNERMLTGKVHSRLLNSKDAKIDWKCDVCNISFNIREKLRDHRREVKCKKRVVCKNKQQSYDLPILEEKSILPILEDKKFAIGVFPIFEENSIASKATIKNDLNTSPSKNELFEDAKKESFQTEKYTDKSSLFSSLMHNSFLSGNEEEILIKYDSQEVSENHIPVLHNETEIKGETDKNFGKYSWNPQRPKRLALSELVSSELPSTSKDDMSPFEAKFNTSPIRKKMLLKCCPNNSTLKKCCLKLNKSPEVKRRSRSLSSSSANMIKESNEKEIL